MFKIIPAEASNAITKLSCPYCGERIPRVGLLRGSRVSGLTFRCGRCGRFWEVIAGVSTETTK